MNFNYNEKTDLSLRDKLRNYGIAEVGSITVHDRGYFSVKGGTSVEEEPLFGRFNDFELNINRVMILYEELSKSNLIRGKELDLKFQLLCEIIIILLMTSLEAYLRDTFIAIISNIKKITENDTNIKKINQIYNEVKKNNPIFQNKIYVKKAYSFLGINLMEIVEKDRWKRIFSKKELNSKTKFIGYMKMRHKFIHNGANESLYKQIILNVDLIETAIIDVAKLVYDIQLNIPDYTMSLMVDSEQLLKHGKVVIIQDKD